MRQYNSVIYHLMPDGKIISNRYRAADLNEHQERVQEYREKYQNLKGAYFIRYFDKNS